MSWNVPVIVDDVEVRITSDLYMTCNETLVCFSVSDVMSMSDHDILARIEIFKKIHREVTVVMDSNDVLWGFSVRNDVISGKISGDELIDMVNIIMSSSLSNDENVRCARNLLNWYNREVETVNAKNAKKKAMKRRRAQFASVREARVLSLINRDGYRCSECGCSENLAVDHIYPLSKGGGDELENLRFLCQSCNSKKGDK